MKQRSSTSRWFPKWIFPILLVLSVATVALRLKIVNTVYEINQTEKLITNSKHERERASLKVAALKSPRRLELLSRTQFKLNQPSSKQVVYLK
jgi:cell division protein FtsL